MLNKLRRHLLYQGKHDILALIKTGGPAEGTYFSTGVSNECLRSRSVLTRSYNSTLCESEQSCASKCSLIMIARPSISKVQSLILPQSHPIQTTPELRSLAKSAVATQRAIPQSPVSRLDPQRLEGHSN